MSEAAKHILPPDSPSLEAEEAPRSVVTPRPALAVVSPASPVEREEGEGASGSPTASLTPRLLGLGVLVLVVVALIITAGVTGAAWALVIGVVGLVVALGLLIVVTLRFVGEGAADESAPTPGA